MSSTYEAAKVCSAPCFPITDLQVGQGTAAKGLCYPAVATDIALASAIAAVEPIVGKLAPKI